MARLDGKVAVITGGASGIGAATARLFVAEGASIVIADRETQRGEKLAGALGAAGAFCETDVTKEAEVAAAVALAVERYGRLDCMFNNAGIPGPGDPVGELDFDRSRAVVDVLLLGVLLGMKHAASVMRAQGSGSIISTASVAGLGVGLGPHVYSACKAAVIHLTRSVANELGEDGIRVNCIAPGAIPTPIFGVGAGLDRDAAEALVPMLAAGMEKAQPIPRSGRPEDIAEAALWLASDASSFVTGDCLVVDGGITTGKLWSQKRAEAEAMAAAAPPA